MYTYTLEIDPSSGEIVKWDHCLLDCPREEPEVVCLDEPVFPRFPDLAALNYTVVPHYELGLEEETPVIRELNLVSFVCPEGAVFEGDENGVEVHALCHDWEWIYSYDHGVTCVRKSKTLKVPNITYERESWSTSR